MSPLDDLAFDDEHHSTNGDAEHGDDGAPPPPQMVLSAVWRSNTLGLAFLEGSTLRFAQIADAAPDFRMLQTVKYQLQPSLIVAPSSSDPAWFAALGLPCLLAPGAVAPGDADDDDPMLDDECDDRQPPGLGGDSAATARILALKNRTATSPRTQTLPRCARARRAPRGRGVRGRGL